MQSDQDGPFPLTPLGSVDLSAIEVISDHVENINYKIVNQNSSHSDPQSLRITKTIPIMRKLTYTEKKNNVYYTNPSSSNVTLDTVQQTSIQLDDLDKLPQCAVLFPNYSKNYGANIQFEAPVFNYSVNCDLTYSDS